MEAARLRFRPILMMSLAFTLGVVPLAIATRASAGSQNAIGTGVMGGMISATILAVFFVPGFFVFVMKLFGRGNAGAARACNAGPGGVRRPTRPPVTMHGAHVLKGRIYDIQDISIRCIFPSWKPATRRPNGENHHDRAA